jgi:hypothetical protein
MIHVHKIGRIAYTIGVVNPAEYDRSRHPTKRDWMRYHRHIAATFPQAPYLCHRTHYKVKANRGAIRTPPGGERLPTGIVNAQGVFLPLWRGKDAHL